MKHRRTSQSLHLLSWLTLSGLLLIHGCTCNNKPNQPPAASSGNAGAPVTDPFAGEQPAPSDGGSKLLDRGRTVYNTNCIACHNANPKLAGSIGPDVHGSSLELLEARIVKATYPEGYKPKRESTAMPAMPYLKGDVPALHAFLNQP